MVRHWWLVYYATPRWTREERLVVAAIWLINIPISICIISIVYWSLTPIHVDIHVAAVAGFFIGFPGGLFISRGVCKWLWPDFVRKADQNATKRMEDGYYKLHGK